MNALDLPIRFTHPHRLFTTEALLAPDNPTLNHAMRREGQARAMAFVDSGLVDAQPGLIDALRERFDRDDTLPGLVDVRTVEGGEAIKNDLTGLEMLARQIASARIDRHSYVLAIGGGAVLDVIGFAAALVHRGVRLVRAPTTTMAQADSGVGVKCGMNLGGVKNLLGAFAVPWAVINDGTLLRSQTQRDWRAGFSEAVKVALVKDAALFDRIEAGAAAIVARDERVAWPVIARSAELHLRHIASGGDPFELGSSRPLDMGHWSAHRLESMTGFATRHGEAVAVGLAIDAIYAGLCSLMPLGDVRRVVATLQALGFTLSHEALADVDGLLQGMDDFREHLGGPLTLILPAGIGRTVTVHHVDRHRMREAVGRTARLNETIRF